LAALDEQPNSTNQDRKLCLLMSGVLDVEGSSDTVHNHQFDLTLRKRGELLPPPLCAGFVALSNDRAELMTQFMHEMAQLVGAWTVHMLTKQ